MADITVIGSFVLDMVAHVDEFPKPGESMLGKSVNFYPGGKGINQCVAAARLGAKTEMIGMLGADANGAVFRKLMTEEGIKSGSVFECGVPTAVAQIQINNASENQIVMIPSANFEFSPSNLKSVENKIEQTEFVLTQLELNREVNSLIISTCKRLGTPLILNPAPAYKLSEKELGSVAYLTPNETELEILTGLPTDTDEQAIIAARKLLDMGVKNVVATLGKRGALIVNADGARAVSGYSVKAVDTVAAGDSFNGALARCLVMGMPLDEAVRFANAVGALTVTKPGAIPSLPYLKEVESFINKHEHK